MLNNLKTTLLYNYSYRALGLLLLSSYANADPLYHIHLIDADVSQVTEKAGDGYIGFSNAEELIEKTVREQLAKKQLLTENRSQHHITLEILIDYQRRFIGDGTPFPTNSITNPTVQFSTTAYLGDIPIREYQSNTLTDLQIHFGGADERGVEKDKQNLKNAATTVVQHIQTNYPEDLSAYKRSTNNMSPEEILAASQKQPKSTAVNNNDHAEYGSKKYIPENVINHYQKMMENAIKEHSAKSFKAFSLMYINDERPYNIIQDYLKRHYKHDDHLKALIWATRALASSGMEQYRATIQNISKDASSKKLRKHAKKILLTFNKKIAEANAVHNTSLMDSTQTWDINQLTNMIKSDIPRLRSKSVKKIYKDHPQNTYLLDLLAHTLHDEATSHRNKYRSYTDYYAWVCRALGNSGNQDYKPLLESMSKEAHSNKVKKYAAKFAETL